jgi:hypothetical protein
MKRDYGTNGNNGTYGNGIFLDFRMFRYFPLFRNLSSSYTPIDGVSTELYYQKPN